MFDALMRDFRQPEYLHVLLNPIPVYVLAAGLIGLLVAIILRSRRAQIATLVIILIAGASAFPVYELGQQAYDRVTSMADEDGQAWLDEHEHRADQLIWCFYALAILTAAAIGVPIKWPKTGTALALVVLLCGTAVLGAGGYIAYAGGKIRHREFRNMPPPKKPAE
jgi:hypothetical protein